MRVVHRYDWNVRFTVRVRDHGTRLLINLVLDHQVDVLADKFFGVPQRHCRLEAMIKHQNLDFSGAISRHMQALGDLPREQVIDPRRSVANLPTALCQPPV